MLCHRAEAAKDFRCCTVDCVFCNVIGGENPESNKLIVGLGTRLGVLYRTRS